MNLRHTSQLVHMARLTATNEVLNASSILAKMSAPSRGKSADTVLRSVLQHASDSNESRSTIPMILVKHRWLKGRNVVVNETLLPFGMDGIARVPNFGNARTAVDQYIQRARGAAEVMLSVDSTPFLAVPPVVVPSQQLVLQDKVKDVEDKEEENEVLTVAELTARIAEVAKSEVVVEDVAQELEPELEEVEPEEPELEEPELEEVEPEEPELEEPEVAESELEEPEDVVPEPTRKKTPPKGRKF